MVSVLADEPLARDAGGAQLPGPLARALLRAIERAPDDRWPSLRAFADAVLDGLRQLGGERLDIVDRVPDWFIQGHRRPPRPHLGRPKGAKDLRPRAQRPAPTSSGLLCTTASGSLTVVGLEG
jgi:hypothetical protein